MLTKRWYRICLDVVTGIFLHQKLLYTQSPQSSIQVVFQRHCCPTFLHSMCISPGFVFNVINIFPCRWPVETPIYELHLLEFLVQSRVTFVFSQVAALVVLLGMCLFPPNLGISLSRSHTLFAAALWQLFSTPKAILSVYYGLCAFTNTWLATSGVRELGQVIEHTCISVGCKVAFRFWCQK